MHYAWADILKPKVALKRFGPTRCFPFGNTRKTSSWFLAASDGQFICIAGGAEKGRTAFAQRRARFRPTKRVDLSSLWEKAATHFTC